MSESESLLVWSQADDIDNPGSYELPGEDVTGLSVTGLSVHRLV